VLDTAVIAPIPSLLGSHAAERPEEVAFRDPRSTLTYAQLDARTARLAGHLLDLGMARQDRFLMYADNSVEVAEGYLVAARAGIVTVCANPSASRAELAYMLDDSGCVVVMTDPQRLALVAELAQERAQLTTVVVVGDEVALPADDGTTRFLRYDDLMARTPETVAPDDTALDDWCWMLYTSGTTGRPKGVHLTQRSCLWVVGACWGPIAGLGPDDRLLSALPLFHSYALVLCVIGVAAVGATATLVPKFSPREVWSRLGAERTTIFPGVPTMFRYLLNAAPAPLDLPDLRLCVSAGALMPAQLNEEFERFAGIPLLDGYGITETSTMVTMNAPTGGRMPGSCGLPLPGLSVRLVGADGRDVLPGEEGELWVQGPNVMLGYHQLPDATASVLTRGWYHTGDLARRDENGFLFISGRVKELIIRGGENIYPAEIEEVLLAADQVQDAAVIAAPHPDLGEVPVACVVPAVQGSLDREQLLAWCRERLSYFKVPAEIYEVNEVPRTGSGKIQRFQLAKQLRSGTTGRLSDDKEGVRA
jgi:acyl-CoA synthetase (AMP-forming)/AMP-acid ligase II